MINIFKQRFIKNSWFSFLGMAFMTLNSFGLNAMLSRLLTPEEFGSYSLSFSIVSLLWVVGNLGMYQTVVKIIASYSALKQYDQIKLYLKKIFTAVTLATVTISIFFVWACYFLSDKIIDFPKIENTSVLIGAWITVTVFERLLAEIFRGFHDIAIANLFGGINGGGFSGLLMLVSLVIVYFFYGESSIQIIFIVFILSSFFSVILGFLLLFMKIKRMPETNKKNTKFNSNKWSTLFKMALPTLIINILSAVIVQADIWVLSIFRGPEEVAIYSISYRTVLLISTPLIIVNSVIPPIVAEMIEKGKKVELENILRAITGLAFVASFVLLSISFLFSKPLLSLLYGDFYSEGSYLLKIFSIGQLISVWSGSVGVVLMMSGNQVSLLFVIVTSSIFMILGEIIMVVNYGSLGVSLISTITLVLQNLFLLLIVRRKIGIWIHAALSPNLLKKLI